MALVSVGVLRNGIVSEKKIDFWTEDVTQLASRELSSLHFPNDSEQ